LEGVVWIHLAQDRDWWLVLVNTIEPLSFIKGREFLDQLSIILTFQEELYSMQLVM
jgi:hypothetical protein